MFGIFSRRIYLDNASATEALPEAIQAMRESERLVGNPGAIHAEGMVAKKALEDARSAVAHELACKSREVVFTSGLTESNDLAILGLARKKMLTEGEDDVEGTHWIVSAIEHDAVLNSFAEIERLDGEVTHVYPDTKGVISPEAVEREVRENTVLVSVGWANNETGVIQPLRDISRAVQGKNGRTLLHSDAGQAPLYVAPHVHTVGVDLLSLGSNKLYGPHGAGALYLSNRVDTANILHGGKQERGLRPGTENVALASGMARALISIGRERNEARESMRKLRDSFAKELVQRIPGLVINGDLDRVLPHMLNISVPDVDAEYVTLALSQKGVAVSTKSACREGEESESHVLRAMFGQGADALHNAWRAQSSFRFSLGRKTGTRELMKAAKIFEACVNLSRMQKSV